MRSLLFTLIATVSAAGLTAVPVAKKKSHIVLTERIDGFYLDMSKNYNMPSNIQAIFKNYIQGKKDLEDSYSKYCHEKPRLCAWAKGYFEDMRRKASIEGQAATVEYRAGLEAYASNGVTPNIGHVRARIDLLQQMMEERIKDHYFDQAANLGRAVDNLRKINEAYLKSESCTYTETEINNAMFAIDEWANNKA